jgi:hypothetical protein
MPDAKPYHSSSFAYATAAVADDLVRIADELREVRVGDLSWLESTVACHAIERLDHQAAALREIACKQYRDEWPTHVEVPPDLVELPEVCDATANPDLIGYRDYPPIDPDAEGPSWDDPEGYRQPRRRR